MTATLVVVVGCARFDYDLLPVDDGQGYGGVAGIFTGRDASPGGASGAGGVGGVGGEGPTDSGAPDAAVPGSGGGGVGGTGGADSGDSGATGGRGGTADAAAPANCSDGIQNQDETDVDCGGATCAACPTCSDGIQNQDETDVDCGGSACAPCPCALGPAQLMGNPNSPGNHVFSPTLSSDGRTMFMAVYVAGTDEQLGVATRPNRGDTFGFATSLPAPVNASIEGTPHVSDDGLRLYFYSERAGGQGGRDLYVASRPNTSVDFGSVNALGELNSAAADHLPWVSPDELTIYFSSDRPGSQVGDIYRATRASPGAAFGAPVVSELSSASDETGTTMTQDGRVAFFASDREGNWDLYRASRATTADPFSTPVNVGALNSGDVDLDPALTADGQELFFVSLRNGVEAQLFRSIRTCF